MSKNKSKEERREQILTAAFSAFVDRGYNNTTVDYIAEKSGLSKGAIYHHYENKKNIFLSLISHWETYSFPDFYDKKSENRTASKILMDFTDVVFDVFKNRKHVFLAEIEFWALSNRDEEIRNRSKELYDKLLNLFDLVLKKGVREDEFVDINTKSVSMSILSVLQGINWFCLYDYDDDSNAKEYLKSSMEILLKGIIKKDV